MLFTTLDWPLSLPVDHSRQPVALKWDGGSLGLVSTLFFQQKCFDLRFHNCFFFKQKIYLFQIKLNEMISEYKTMHIILTVHLDCRGRVPVTGMLAGMNMSKPGMNLSKPGMNLSKPGEKHNNHVMIYNKKEEYITKTLTNKEIAITVVSHEYSSVSNHQCRLSEWHSGIPWSRSSNQMGGK